MTLKSKNNIVVLTMIFITIFNLKAKSQVDESLVAFYDWNSALAGYKNKIGEIIIPAQFDYADNFYNNLAIVCQNGKYGYIDKQGNQVLSFQFDIANRFNSGYAIVKKNSQWLIINPKGQTLKSLDYKLIYQYDTLYMVTKYDRTEYTDLYGYLNYKGEEIIKPRMRDSFHFSDGLSNFGYYKDGNVYMNTRLEVALYLKCDTKAGHFNEGLAAIVLNGKVGFINTKGELAISADYDFDDKKTLSWLPTILPTFRNGYAIVQKNGKYGIINKKGQTVIPFRYEFVNDVDENGIAEITLNKKKGAIDVNGNLVIQPIYDFLGDFDLDGVARAELNNKFGFVDRSGKIVVPFIYDLVYDYNQGAPFGQRNGKWALLNKQGKPVTQFQFEEVYGDFYEGLACVKLNGKYGYISKSGKVIIDFKFESGQKFSKGVLEIFKSGDVTYYNKRGRPISL